MAEEVSKCGPICQHPGCWHTSSQAGPVQEKDTDYMRFLSELLLRKKELKRLQARDGMTSHACTHTSDGLPTLKVHSISHPYGKIDAQRRRSKTLPPLKICTRKCSTTKHELHSKSNVNYVQMQLQVDDVALNSDLCSELLFSPVLLWRPGRKHPSPSNATANLEAQRTYRQREIVTPLPDVEKTSNNRPFLRQSHLHTPPSAVEKTQTGKDGGKQIHVRVKERRETEAGGRRVVEYSTTRKSHLPVKTTNLTDALPPQESFESVVNEHKGISAEVKHGRHRQRVTTADAECFAYLGDISPQVVAEILHQLRSESSSSIDGTTFRFPSAPPYNTAKQQSQEAYPSTQAQVPLATPPHLTHHSTTQHTHLPASLAYELSTGRVLKRSPVRPNRRRVTSFSRELSKRPLEVLRRRPNQVYSRQPMLEKILAPKAVRSGQREEGAAKEEPTAPLSQPTKKRSCQMHLPTAAIEPPTDLPPGVRPHYQRSFTETVLGNLPGISPTHYSHHYHQQQSTDTRPSHNPVSRQQDEGSLTNQEEPAVLQPRVPSTIVMQLQQGDSAEQYKAPGLESRRSRYSHVLSPKHQLTAVPRSTVVYPFSEETSPILEIETRALLKRRESLSTGSAKEKKSQEESRKDGLSVEREHSDIQPSVSPDYMLVGAHFTDNNLVLVDKDGRIIHQLTDTEAESDANIIAHLSDLSEHSETDVHLEQQSTQVKCLDSNNSVSSDAESASKPGTGVKAPPPTAVEVSHEREEITEASNSLQVHVPEVNGERQESGAVLQEDSVTVAPSQREDKNDSKLVQDGTASNATKHLQDPAAVSTVIQEGDEPVIDTERSEVGSNSSVRQQEVALSLPDHKREEATCEQDRSQEQSRESVTPPNTEHKQNRKASTTECEEDKTISSSKETNGQTGSSDQMIPALEIASEVIHEKFEAETVQDSTTLNNGQQQHLVVSPTNNAHEESEYRSGKKIGQEVSNGELNVRKEVDTAVDLEQERAGSEQSDDTNQKVQNQEETLTANGELNKNTRDSVAETNVEVEEPLSLTTNQKSQDHPPDH